jgi:ABC-2 type transport system permease protein
VRPANVRGRELLSEALSNYSAMMVTEKAFGPSQARRVYDFQLDRYLSRRQSFARDVPLVEVEEHPHIAYGKGIDRVRDNYVLDVELRGMPGQSGER